MNTKDKFTCPRRVEDGAMHVYGGPNSDHWDVRALGENPKCSYCGSIHPDAFMVRIKAGEELEPTDKSYKAYLPGKGVTKFYYQHLSEEQRREFVQLLNEGKIQFPTVEGIRLDFNNPFGGVLPFFIQRGRGQ